MDQEANQPVQSDEGAAGQKPAGEGGGPPETGQPGGAAGGGGGPPPPSGPLVRPRQRNWLGLYFIVLSLLTFYVLVATWPVVVPWQPSQFYDAWLFGVIKVGATADSRLFITVVAAGALGSLVHVLTSFADYVGNRNLRQSWIWFFVLRTPVGIALALLFYLVLRGGLIVPTLPESSGQTPTATLISPFGLAAIAAMAGMFSKQATDKLSEVFNSLFQVAQPVPRGDPLTPAKPVIASAEPESLTVNGDPSVALNGRNFDQQCKVTVNGKERQSKWESATRVTVSLLATEDLKDQGELTLVVRNPVAAGGDSAPFTVPVGPA